MSACRRLSYRKGKNRLMMNVTTLQTKSSQPKPLRSSYALCTNWIPFFFFSGSTKTVIAGGWRRRCCRASSGWEQGERVSLAPSCWWLHPRASCPAPCQGITSVVGTPPEPPPGRHSPFPAPPGEPREMLHDLAHRRGSPEGSFLPWLLRPIPLGPSPSGQETSAGVGGE